VPSSAFHGGFIHQRKWTLHSNTCGGFFKQNIGKFFWIAWTTAHRYEQIFTIIDQALMSSKVKGILFEKDTNR
jgi:hypothetical protein